ncbi:ectoine/hydroxyectoine ABC transporter substrate-binding protein EhuB [Leucobacter sp. CSA2]|uniref:Ectoine/hydroxyectoine ABC transporter substrate-binding protein EhuB n=1 Tax=Leucobacter edaphi TaxID=2796472 RepID=A0A934QEV3_9MICO|nr:ectoine/hydroxyectoine ABC transporter substrate-binding protein EhuB [Leucobacter edaphi]MBK0421912.1 ectoine/hydroxyectoine ABC transporter substrate-binding protein EhuB [Leucobacter edaphi]
MAHIISQRTRRLTAVIVGGAFLAGVLAGCTTTSPGGGGGGSAGGGASGVGKTVAQAKKDGYLRVAIANEPPYTQVNADGTVTGAEPDVLHAVLKTMDIPEIEGVTTPYESMIPGLNAGRWDVVAAGLFMKQSRCAAVAYSEPVIVSTESFGVPVGNPKNITTVKNVLDNKDLKIAVLSGGFEEGILKTAKVPSNQQVLVKDARSGMEAVTAKRADAFLLPTLSLNDLVKSDKSIEVTKPIEDAPKTGSGAAFRKEDKELRDEYNKALAKFKETPEFAKILEKWGFDPEAVKGVTSEELCKNEG